MLLLLRQILFRNGYALHGSKEEVLIAVTFVKMTEKHVQVHIPIYIKDTVELQWLEYLWNHVIMFETGVVRANEF